MGGGRVALVVTLEEEGSSFSSLGYKGRLSTDIFLYCPAFEVLDVAAEVAEVA